MAKNKPVTDDLLARIGRYYSQQATKTVSEPRPLMDHEPTHETKARLKPDIIRLLYARGSIDQMQYGNANEIREIFEAVTAKFLSSSMGRISETDAPGFRSKHPLQSLHPKLRKNYLEKYLPWIRRQEKVRVNGVRQSEVTLTVLVGDATTGQMDTWQGWRHGTSVRALRASLDDYG